MGAPSLTDDTRLRACVRALWALVEAVRSGDAGETERMAEAAVIAVEEARGLDGYLLLHEIDGAIHLSGRRVPLGMDSFRAAQELVGLLRDREIGEVLFDAGAGPDAMLSWARGCVDAARLDPGDGEELPLTTRRVVGGVEPEERGSRPCGPDSRLSSVFLQHRLIQGFTEGLAVLPHLGKVTVAAVVDRMLAVESGLEPLTLLQRDPDKMRRAVHVSVFGVAFGRVLGWPEQSLTDLGAAALLFDVGGLIDAGDPGRAGFRWLLGLGCDPFWLRCAIVQRSWRRDHGSALSDLDADSSLSACLVRLAADVEEFLTAGGTLAELDGELGVRARAGAYPAELAHLAAETSGRMVAG